MTLLNPPGPAFLSRGAPPLRSAHSPASFSAPPPLQASPRSFSKGACPLDLGSAPPFGASVSPHEGNSRSLAGWSTSEKAGGRKRAGKPRTLLGLSSPRAVRLRSWTLSNAERAVAWPVEDGVWSVMSGGDGGVVWWSFGGGVVSGPK